MERRLLSRRKESRRARAAAAGSVTAALGPRPAMDWPHGPAPKVVCQWPHGVNRRGSINEAVGADLTRSRANTPEKRQAAASNPSGNSRRHHHVLLRSCRTPGADPGGTTKAGARTAAGRESPSGKQPRSRPSRRGDGDASGSATRRGPRRSVATRLRCGARFLAASYAGLCGCCCTRGGPPPLRGKGQNLARRRDRLSLSPPAPGG